MDYEGFRQMVLGAILEPTKAAEFSKIYDAYSSGFGKGQLNKKNAESEAQ